MTRAQAVFLDPHKASAYASPMRFGGSVALLFVAAPVWAKTSVVLLPVVPLRGEAEQATADEMTAALREAFSKDDALTVKVGTLPIGEGRAARRPASSVRDYEKALQDLDKARADLEQLRVPQAVRTLERALPVLVRSLDRLESYDRLIDAQLLLAEAHFRQGKEQRGTDVLERVARLRPDWVLDENRFPPVFVSQFASARQRALARKPGSIRVTSGGAGAEVFVNGRRLGVAPVMVEHLVPGENHVVVRAGGASFVDVVDVPEGGLVAVHVALGDATSLAALLAQNRFDHNVARLAREAAQGSDYVLVFAIGSGDGVLAVGGLMGTARTGKWMALEPVAPDYDMLSASVEANQVLLDVKKKIAAFAPDVGKEAVAVIAGKPMDGAGRAEATETVVSFAEPGSSGARAPIVPAEPPLGPAASRRPVGASEIDAAEEIDLELIAPPPPEETEPAVASPAVTTGRGPVVEKRVDVAPVPAETIVAHEITSPQPIASASGPLSRPDLDAEAEVQQGGVLKTWWFWTVVGVGAVAIAGGTWAVVSATSEPETVQVYAVW